MDNKIRIFVERLKKIGVEVELIANAPWVYLTKVNGRVVKEKYYAKHGFTIGFLPIKKHQKFKFTELSEIFKTIKKYK